MKLILGVTGSIAAFKSVNVLRLFQKNGHQVSVVMTKSAKRLIVPLTFEAFVPGKVYYSMFKKNQDPLIHINICKENDFLLIAPATANIIGKMASGIADDLLSTVCLAFEKKVAIAPAMHSSMYEKPVVLENISKLKSRGVEIIEPEEGELASDDEGKGRLASEAKIYDYCLEIINGK